MEQPARVTSGLDSLNKGYTFSGSVDLNQPIVSNPRFPGDHGYDSALPEMRGLFFYIGPNVNTISADIVNIPDVSTSIGWLLKINLPDSFVGKSIFK